MKHCSKKLNDSPKLMIIPMIDIIFFLLVFFMLSTIYAVPQKSMAISLPKAKTQETNALKPLVIDVNQKGEIFVDQKLVKDSDVKNMLKQNLATDKNKHFLIRADENVNYGRVVTLMDEMKLAGVTNVSIATVHK